MELTIKREYADLLSPHSEEEIQELTDSCILDGIREKIIHNPQGIILDGMTRYAIAQDNDLPFECLEMKLDSEHAERDWIIKNQLGRRNLSAQQMSILRGKLYLERKGTNGGPRAHIDSISDLEFPNETDSFQSGGERVVDQIAEETGVSAGVIQRDAKKLELVSALPETIRKQYESDAVKLTLPQLQTLLDCDRIQEVDRAIRVGQSNDVFEAYLAVTKTPLKKARKKNPATVEETAAAEEEEEPVDLSPEEKMKQSNSAIEKFCKSILKDFQAGLTTLGASNPWIQLHGRDDTAESGLKSGLKTLRSCKGTAICPKCDGVGCQSCYETGWLDKETASQS